MTTSAVGWLPGAWRAGERLGWKIGRLGRKTGTRRGQCLRVAVLSWATRDQLKGCKPSKETETTLLFTLQILNPLLT